MDDVTENSVDHYEETIVVVPVNKESFLQQYVLNRAATCDNLSGEGAAKEATHAWNYIKAELKRSAE